MITLEYLKEALSYDPDTGVLTWREDRPRSHFKNLQGHYSWFYRFAGKEAGCVHSRGYRHITFGNREYKAHRLAWLYTYCEWPVNQIDHINGLKLDNRIVNLRDVSPQENIKNQKRRCNNKSGITGVSWHKSSGKWQADIQSDGKSVYLGLFGDISDAAKARKEAEKRYGFHENHGRSNHLV